MLAIATIIAHVPKEVYLDETDDIIPIIFRSLTLADSTLKVTMINIIYLLLLENARSMQYHLSTTVSKLIEMIESDGFNIVTPHSYKHRSNREKESRSASLRCLQAVSDVFRYEQIFPYKSIVLNAISGSLDDQNRSVRKDAVDARHKWFMKN